MPSAKWIVKQREVLGGLLSHSINKGIRFNHLLCTMNWTNNHLDRLIGGQDKLTLSDITKISQIIGEDFDIVFKEDV